ncbi:hypothetical protein EZS27_025397, partial [termite gut metagenome]
EKVLQFVDIVGLGLVLAAIGVACCGSGGGHEPIASAYSNSMCYFLLLPYGVRFGAHLKGSVLTAFVHSYLHKT